MRTFVYAIVAEVPCVSNRTSVKCEEELLMCFVMTMCGRRLRKPPVGLELMRYLGADGSNFDVSERVVADVWRRAYVLKVKALMLCFLAPTSGCALELAKSMTLTRARSSKAILLLRLSSSPFTPRGNTLHLLEATTAP